MDLHPLIIQNRFILEAVYALIISAICAVIVLKTDKFFRLSLHTGIRFFRNAFLFFGVAFIARYVFGIFSDLAVENIFEIQFLFEYFLVMGGFFLLYSLIWKRFETSNERYFSSLINTKVAIFHVMAVIIALLDVVWMTYRFMFFSQMIVFFYAMTIAYSNFRKDKRKHKFPLFYLVAMFLGLVAWVLNFLAQAYFSWDKGLLVNIGLINILFFLLLLYGVIKVTKIK